MEKPNKSEKKYLAIDIGGTFTKYAVMDGEGRIRERGKIATVQDSAEHFISMTEYLFRKYGGGTEGIAVSSAGRIDSDRGLMYNAGSILCVEHLEFVQELQKRCGVPVTLENDARCAAMAELWKGALAGCRDGMVVILGTAVGGAVIVNGKLLRGSHFMAGELSYLLTQRSDPFNPVNTLARCGGVPALLDLASDKTGINRDELSGERVFEMVKKGNKGAREALEIYANRIAVLINNCQFLFDPQKVAVGGGISAQPLLLELIRSELKKLAKVYPYQTPMPQIEACRYYNDSNLIGALYVHLMKWKASM